MNWSNKDWGSALIGLGIGFLLFSVKFSAQLMSTVNIGIGSFSATATEIPPASALGAIVGLALILIGAYLRKR